MTDHRQRCHAIEKATCLRIGGRADGNVGQAHVERHPRGTDRRSDMCQCASSPSMTRLRHSASNTMTQSRQNRRRQTKDKPGGSQRGATATEAVRLRQDRSSATAIPTKHDSESLAHLAGRNTAPKRAGARHTFARVLCTLRTSRRSKHNSRWSAASHSLRCRREGDTCCDAHNCRQPHEALGL